MKKSRRWWRRHSLTTLNQNIIDRPNCFYSEKTIMKKAKSLRRAATFLVRANFRSRPGTLINYWLINLVINILQISSVTNDASKLISAVSKTGNNQTIEQNLKKKIVWLSSHNFGIHLVLPCRLDKIKNRLARTLECGNFLGQDSSTKRLKEIGEERKVHERTPHA